MAKSTWTTKKIVDLLAPHCYDIVVRECDGDVDTETVMCQARQDIETRLHVAGFICEGWMTENRSVDVPVDHVEVTDGRDSRGGWNGSDMDEGVMYGKIVATLREAGFSVVPSMSRYF